MLSRKWAFGFRDVLIQPQQSDIRSRKDVSLERTFKFKNSKTLTCIPIIASNMEGIGSLETARVLSKYKILTCLQPSVPLPDKNHLVSYTIPTVKLNDYTRLNDLVRLDCYDLICLDVANGYMGAFLEFVWNVKEMYPRFIVMAGNVATRKGAEALLEAGADIVKVGLGSGSVCTTRYKTGVGVPQVTAVDDCLKAGEALYCSDGGCTNPGDVAKAFVAGADFVMLGGMLAGTDETGTEFHGEAYLQETPDGKYYRTSEGKLVEAPQKGSLEGVIKDILGGLRSTGSYIGQRDIKDFKKAELILTNEQTNDWLGPPN